MVSRVCVFWFCVTVCFRACDGCTSAFDLEEGSFFEELQCLSNICVPANAELFVGGASRETLGFKRSLDESKHVSLSAKKMPRVEESTEAVLHCLRVQKGSFVRQSELSGLVNLAHKKSSLYKIIIALRMRSFNVEHALIDNQSFFRLARKDRFVQKGSYEKKLWEMLDDENILLHWSACDCALHLSDLGFDPVFNRVEVIKLLKVLMSPKNAGGTDRDKARAAAWDIIVKEGFVRSVSHYVASPATHGYLTYADAELLKSCWVMRQELFFGYSANLSELSLR